MSTFGHQSSVKIRSSTQFFSNTVLPEGNNNYQLLLMQARERGVNYNKAQCLDIDELDHIDFQVVSGTRRFRIEIHRLYAGVIIREEDDQGIMGPMLPRLALALAKSSQLLVLVREMWFALKNPATFTASQKSKKFNIKKTILKYTFLFISKRLCFKVYRRIAGEAEDNR